MSYKKVLIDDGYTQLVTFLELKGKPGGSPFSVSSAKKMKQCLLCLLFYKLVLLTA